LYVGERDSVLVSLLRERRCVLAGLVVFYLIGFDHEPRYGRSLSSWVLISQDIWAGKLTRPG